MVAVAAVLKYLQTLKSETVTDQLPSFDPTSVQDLHIQISNEDSKDEFVPVRVVSDDYEEPLGPDGSSCHVAFLDADGNPSKVADVHYRIFDSTGVSTVVSYGDESERQDVFVHLLGKTSTGFKVMFHGFEYKVACLDPRQHELSRHLIEKEKPDMSKFVLSPMPGAVIRVFVSAGQKVRRGFPFSFFSNFFFIEFICLQVEEGQNLFVLEAMKMQNIIRAEKAGVIKALRVTEGHSVETDEILVEWE